MSQVIFETGATTHAVNDLILFTDNTRELAELRDEIYTDWVQNGLFGISLTRLKFVPLFNAARKQYCKELKDSCSHTLFMPNKDFDEYCQIYVDDFNNWKSEHGYK